MANEIEDIGNNAGGLYITDAAGTSILYQFANDSAGVRQMLQIAATVGIVPWEVFRNTAPNPPLNNDYDPTFGYRFWINADYTGGGAAPGTLVDAVEITHYVVNKGLQSNIDIQSHVISSGKITVVKRRTLITKLVVDTEGAAASDFLDEIEVTEALPGDIIIIVGTDASRVITLRDVATTGQNLHLAEEKTVKTGDQALSITLQYERADNTVVGQWVEVSRSEPPSVTVSDLRDDDIAVQVQGINTTALTLTGQTITLDHGVSKEVLRLTGSGVLSGNITVDLGPNQITGDYFEVLYDANITYSGAFTITILGITLSAHQAQRGGYIVKTKYDSAYIPTMLSDVRSQESQTIFYEKFTIPEAEVLTLNSVGYNPKPSPGSTKSVKLMDVAGEIITYSGTPYATNGIVRVGCVGASDSQFEIAANAFLFGTVARKVHFTKTVVTGITDTQIVKNAGLVVSVDTGDPTNAGTGSDIVLHIWYSIIEE